MKKILLTFVGVILCLTAGAQVTIGDFTYNFYSSGNAYVQKYNGTDTEVTIPATITVDEVSRKVTGIGVGAFEGNTTIQKVHLSTNGRYNLNKNSFKGCTSLTVLNWAVGSGASSTYTGDGFYLGFYDIPESAFEGCTSITSASFRYSNVADIGNAAFKGCTKLKTAYLYADKVGANVFDGCTALTQARFYKVSSFAEGALDGIPTGAIVPIAFNVLSDELLSPIEDKLDQVKVYLNFNSTIGYIRLISSKRAFSLNSTTLTVKYVSSVTETASDITVEVTDVPSKVLPANTALLVQFTGSSTSTSPYYTLPLAANPEVTYTNFLFPVTENVSLNSEGTTNYYKFAPTSRTDFTTFTKITSATTLEAGSGYLKVVDGSAVTGIKEVKPIKIVGLGNDEIYTLSGVRVTNPTKGIYIRGGKKYVVK